MQTVPVNPEDLTVGQPVPWPLYDASGRIVTEEGFRPESVRQIRSWIDAGVGRCPDSPPAQADRLNEPGKPEAPGQARQEPGELPLQALKLQIGDSIQLEFSSGAEKSRCLVTLIGYLAEQSVIVSMPVSEGRPAPIREGQNLVARCFSGRTAYAFSTVATKAAGTPYPHLHLSYPREVRGLVVRSSPRVQAHIECHASMEDGNHYPCVARDLSVDGALIACREQMGKPGDTLLLQLPVELDGDRHVLDLNCQIRSVNTSRVSPGEAPVNLFGLAFRRMERKDGHDAEPRSNPSARVSGRTDRGPGR